jgi:hypothetical protein
MSKIVTEDKIKLKKVKKGTSYGEIPELVRMVNSVKNTGLSVPSLMNLIKLKAELKTTLEEYNEALKGLLEGKHGLKLENGGYTFVDHPKESEIRAEITQLQETEVKIKSKLNFLTTKELGASTQNLDLAIISEIAEKLAVID